MARRREQAFVPWIYDLFRRILGLALRVRCRFRSHDYAYIPAEGGVIIASNHASFLDPPVLGVAVPHRPVRFMARDTLFDHSFLAWFYYRFGVVPLSREKGDVGAIKTAIQLLREGHCVALFPEGTRTPDGHLQPAKGGVGFLIHKANVPVVPAYIRGSYEAWPKGAKKMKSAPVSVHFGPPISPEALCLTDDRGKPDYMGIGAMVMARIAELRDAAANPGS
ncbi:MAG TPA: lysophospholipid acyltransferase family protein [Kiritimatiellia bacterium]|nr:lysophospholipid acyltransferase family protein [Kiritimatiellia bacterium]HMO98029.1 lysophospholipid acyltransferase family protein [Kiritimatiellia bacterium]HMP96554.1 lysophospholipid acyltransferase family protein [Kiritimatiellia bacterium]